MPIPRLLPVTYGCACVRSLGSGSQTKHHRQCQFLDYFPSLMGVHVCAHLEAVLKPNTIVNANSSITSRHLWVCMCALTWKRFSNSRPQIPHAHTVVLCASTCFVIFFKSLTGFR